MDERKGGGGGGQGQFLGRTAVADGCAFVSELQHKLGCLLPWL